MTFSEVMEKLEELGNERTKTIYLNHGAQEPLFGVKVTEMKKYLVKKIKINQSLAEALYKTGNSDACYLACLIADAKTIPKAMLKQWMQAADWYMQAEYAVAPLAADSRFGFELGNEWIEVSQDLTAAGGWSTLSSFLTLTPKDEISIDWLNQKLDLIESQIHVSGNRQKYAMNQFLISAGMYIPSMRDKVLAICEKVGKVSVYMGKTSCKVPLAGPYIQKAIEKRGEPKRKKQARC